MSNNHLAKALLAAGFGCCSMHAAEAGWKLNPLSPPMFMPVALSDDAVALGTYYQVGQNFGAFAAPNYLQVFNYCGATGGTEPSALGADGSHAGTCRDYYGDLLSAYVYSAETKQVSYINGPTDVVPTGVYNGLMVGNYVIATATASVPSGFIYTIATRTMQPFLKPGSISTQIAGMTETGIVYGSFVDTQQVEHGFTYLDGAFTQVDVPGASWTAVTGVNVWLQVVGAAQTGSVQVAFFLQDGKLLTLHPPKSVSADPLAINVNGQVVGDSVDGAGTMTGFRWTPTAGTVSYIHAPAGTADLVVTGINDSGAITGNYIKLEDGDYTGFIGYCSGAGC